MSTIDVANLSDAESTTTNSGNSSDVLNNTTTLDTKYITNGSAKSWVSFTTVSTSAIYESLNVSSIADNGVGETSVNITNNMSSSTYCITACAGRNTSPNNPAAQWIYQPTASEWQHETMDNSGSYLDAEYNYSAAHGELA